MNWDLNFISEEEFKGHVRATIMKYGEKLESYDLKRFNSNLIDPIILLLLQKRILKCKGRFLKMMIVPVFW